MSKEVPVTHLFPHSMYITQLTYVNINNKIQMQTQRPVNITSPKLENGDNCSEWGKT